MMLARTAETQAHAARKFGVPAQLFKTFRLKKKATRDLTLGRLIDASQVR
jgi:hypothetical protein